MNALAQTQGGLQSDLPRTLEVLAWETELAGARCIFLDKMIGELMLVVPADQRERLVDGMHVVDLLSQHLTSLSAFSRRLSADAPTDWIVDVGPALGEITLGALADRMATGLGAAEAPAGDTIDSGDLDLF